MAWLTYILNLYWYMLILKAFGKLVGIIPSRPQKEKEGTEMQATTASSSDNTAEKKKEE